MGVVFKMAKFKIGESLIYGTVGLVEIVDIRQDSAVGTVHEYYVLRECASASDSQIFVPTDNGKLVSNMRPLISCREAKRLLSLDKRMPVEWVRDNRLRSEKFRAVIESGNREAILSLISAIQNVKRERIAAGKKNYLLDENILEKAKRLIISEFSAVLKKTEAEIREILEKI